jgi:hypothetical protein
MLRIGVEESTDHALILCAMLFSFTLEELDAALR